MEQNLVRSMNPGLREMVTTKYRNNDHKLSLKIYTTTFLIIERARCSQILYTAINTVIVINPAETELTSVSLKPYKLRCTFHVQPLT